MEKLCTASVLGTGLRGGVEPGALIPLPLGMVRSTGDLGESVCPSLSKDLLGSALGWNTGMNEA